MCVRERDWEKEEGEKVAGRKLYVMWATMVWDTRNPEHMKNV